MIPLNSCNQPSVNGGKRNPQRGLALHHKPFKLLHFVRPFRQIPMQRFARDWKSAERSWQQVSNGRRSWGNLGGFSFFFKDGLVEKGGVLKKAARGNVDWLAFDVLRWLNQWIPDGFIHIWWISQFVLLEQRRGQRERERDDKTQVLAPNWIRFGRLRSFSFRMLAC